MYVLLSAWPDRNMWLPARDGSETGTARPSGGLPQGFRSAVGRMRRSAEAHSERLEGSRHVDSAASTATERMAQQSQVLLATAGAVQATLPLPCAHAHTRVLSRPPAGYDHTIKFWEAPSGICQRTLQHPESQVNKLEITPDKSAIAAAGNPSLRLFDLRTGTATSYDGHTNNVTAVGFQRDGKWLFTGSEDGTIKIWDVRAPGCQREYESGCAINSVAIHPSQGELISGDRDGNIRVWDLAQNACSAELVPDGPKAIRCVSVAHDASLLAAANDYGSVFVWRIGTSDEKTSTRFEPLQKLQVRHWRSRMRAARANAACRTPVGV